MEGGSFEIRLGASSRDIRLAAVVDLVGDDIAAPLSPSAPTSSWLDHPTTGPRLRASLGTGAMAAMLVDANTADIMRAIPWTG